MKLLKRKAGDIDREIGARIKAARREQRMSQEKLAEALGVQHQQVQKYESGSNRVAASTLLLIAEALGVPPLALLTGPRHEHGSPLSGAPAHGC